jgi:hypothetical protein
MAKKEKADSDKKTTNSKADPEWVTCTSYHLEIVTDPFSLTLDQIMPGDLNLNDEEFEHPPLVQDALQAIAASYPDVGWQFQVDDKGWITKVRAKPKK